MRAVVRVRATQAGAVGGHMDAGTVADCHLPLCRVCDALTRTGQQTGYKYLRYSQSVSVRSGGVVLAGS